MLVRDLMNPDPAKLRATATLSQALTLMAEEKVRHVVVVDEGEEVVGILSDRDLALFYDPVEMTRERWSAVTVGQLMTADPVVTGSATEIRPASQVLMQSGGSALPVVDNGELRGILSERDFVRYYAREGDGN